MKGACGFNCCLPIAPVDLFGDDRLAAAPIVPEWLHQGGDNETLNIRPRRVVGSKRMAFVSVERAFEQGAKDCRFDIAPARVGGFDE